MIYVVCFLSKAMIIESNPVNMTAVVSEPIQLQCRSPSYPRPQVTWKKDGKVLPYTEQTINKIAHLSDSGTYECVVSSIHGKDLHMFNLKVEGIFTVILLTKK